MTRIAEALTPDARTTEDKLPNIVAVRFVTDDHGACIYLDLIEPLTLAARDGVAIEPSVHSHDYRHEKAKERGPDVVQIVRRAYHLFVLLGRVPGVETVKVQYRTVTLTMGRVFLLEDYGMLGRVKSALEAALREFLGEDVLFSGL